MPIPLSKSQGHVGVINKYKFRRNLKTKQNKTKGSVIYMLAYIANQTRKPATCSGFGH